MVVLLLGEMRSLVGFFCSNCRGSMISNAHVIMQIVSKVHRFENQIVCPSVGMVNLTIVDLTCILLLKENIVWLFSLKYFGKS